MLIVYRKSDKEILFNSGPSFIAPEGPSDINGKLAVMEQIGGTYEDYGTYRLHDVNDKEKVDLILDAHEIKLIFDADDKPIDFEVIKTKAEWLADNPPQPTETEKLKADLKSIQEALDFLLMNGGI